MMIIIWTVLFTVGGCTQEYTTKIVSIGEDVTLTCSPVPNSTGLLFWMKFVAGNLPEVLVAAYTFNTGTINRTPRITARIEPGTFVLNMKQTELSDTGFYYCEEITELKKSLSNFTFLRVKGPEAEITTIIQELPSLAVVPGDTVTLQCSVMSESAGLLSLNPHDVHWFKAASDESHPNKLYINGKTASKCDWIPESLSVNKCVQNFSLHNISSSDAGTYYCAVATCGQLLFGNGTKLEIQGPSYLSYSLGITILIFLLFAALAICVTHIVRLNHTVKKLKREFNAIGDSEITADEHYESINEDGLVYSVAKFVMKRTNQKLREV